MTHFQAISWLSCTLIPRHAFLWTSRLKTHQPAATTAWWPAPPPSIPPSQTSSPVAARPQEKFLRQRWNRQLTWDAPRVRTYTQTMTCDEAENQRPLAGQKRPNRPAMAEFRPENKKAKIEVTLASSESGQLSQIESEFQILKSLIPDIANRQQINEVSL